MLKRHRNGWGGGGLIGVWDTADSGSLVQFLGRTLSPFNNYWPAVEQNLQRERGKWGRLEKIFGREVADRRTVGRFYLAVVQAVVLFRFETWVLTPRLEKSLEGFHHQAVWQMAGMGPNFIGVGHGCIHPFRQR